MTVSFRPAKRENVSLLIGLAGGTGSGKTMSAMLLAKGLAGGRPFAVIDTEAGRALHYADDFSFEHADLVAPFRPSTYADAIHVADKAGYPVIVVDSFSHEHAGDGGLLDWHEEEVQRMAGDNAGRREAVKMAAWIKPKMAHKAMVNQLLQVRAHLILCFRAEEKVDIVKVNGKTEIVPKVTLTGLNGWVPVCEKSLPYELTVSFLVTADKPGVPKPIKLPDRLRGFFPLDKPIGEEAGRELGRWAAGDAKVALPFPSAPVVDREPDPSPVSADFGEPIVDDETAAAIEAAGYVVTVTAKDSWVNGLTLADIASRGEEGAAFFRWAVSDRCTGEMRARATAFARVQFPELVLAGVA